jgi:hypothetical protein
MIIRWKSIVVRNALDRKRIAQWRRVKPVGKLGEHEQRQQHAVSQLDERMPQIGAASARQRIAGNEPADDRQIMERLSRTTQY